MALCIVLAGYPPQRQPRRELCVWHVPSSQRGLTTLAAFMPIIVIEGVFGRIASVLPIVVFAVLVGSLLECYFILPAHMRHALSFPQKESKGIRQSFRDWFERFRQTRFPKVVSYAYDNRYTTLSAAFGALLVAIGLLAGGVVAV